MSGTGPTAAVRGYLLDEHADLVGTVLDCADAVAAGWDGVATTDRDRVVPPLRAALERAGVLDRLPVVLDGCVAAAGGELSTRPVAAPPYVVVTSRGPMLRARFKDGRPTEADRSPGPTEADRSPGSRLVVTVRVFAVERTAGARYVRGPTDHQEAVAVRFGGGQHR